MAIKIFLIPYVACIIFLLNSDGLRNPLVAAKLRQLSIRDPNWLIPPSPYHFPEVRLDKAERDGFHLNSEENESPDLKQVRQN